MEKNAVAGSLCLGVRVLVSTFPGWSPLRRHRGDAATGWELGNDQTGRKNGIRRNKIKHIAVMNQMIRCILSPYMSSFHCYHSSTRMTWGRLLSANLGNPGPRHVPRKTRPPYMAFRMSAMALFLKRDADKSFHTQARMLRRDTFCVWLGQAWSHENTQKECWLFLELETSATLGKEEVAFSM